MNGIEISLLLPSRARPQFLRRFLESINQTVQRPDKIEIVVYLDEDDSQLEIFYPNLRLVKLIGPRQTMGNLNMACYHASNGNYIMLVNDDLVFRTKGWDVKIIDAFSRFPDGIALVYVNDLIQGRRLAAFPILSRVACEIIEEVFPAEYLKTAIDTHLFSIFKILSQLGYRRIIYLKDVIAEHMHHSIGKSQSVDSSLIIDPLIDLETFGSLARDRLRAAIRLGKYIQKKALRKRFPRKERLLQHKVSLIVTPQPSLTFLKQLIKNNSEKVPFELIVVGKRKDFKEATFTKNLNDAIKIAKGDFIVFLAPSCFPLPGWLDEMLRVALKDRRVKLVGPKLINPRNSRIEHAGICYFKEKSILRATCIYKGLDAEDPLVNKKRRFQAVSTLCMLVRKGVLQGEINSLEDLCFKVHSQGGWIFYAPEASLYYDGPASIEIPVYRGAKADLKRILSRDGFLIHQDDGVYKILPSRRLIKRLRREKEFIRLYELLECAILGLNKDEKLSSFYNKEMERLLRDLLSWENKNILSLIELPIRGNPMRDAKARILFYRGVILGEGGGVDQGLVYLERALELCEHRILRVNILLHKWILLKKKGLLREAENSFCEAMAYEEYPANLTFGNYFRTQGRLKEAIKIYEDGLAKAKEENLRIRFLYAMASTLKDLGRYYESIRGFKKILRKKLPAHMFHMVGGAHFHLGDNFARLGRVCKARHHLERCLKYMPEHQKAKILLKNLSGS